MSFPVSISVHADSGLGPLKPIYRFFGTDEINYVYMKDGEKLISKLENLGKDQVFFRAHNQFVTGKGINALKWGSTNAYTEDESGKPIYDWTIIDRIYDTYLARNVKPYVQFGFMPEALSTHPTPYQHSWTPHAPYDQIYTGWAYPPKDYMKWGELIHQWTKHCIDRYGLAEVESWYFETWNEPNIGYWQGTPEEFYALHDFAIEGLRRALPNAKVGGPETADGGSEYLRAFFEHCLDGQNVATGQKGSPLDFVSFHAKGKPEFIAETNHVRMDIACQLRQIDSAMQVIASFPELKSKPIVIGESDPEGAAAAQGPQLSYRNGTMYSSYTAASFARKHDIADKHGVNLEGALTWAFEFEDQPYFAGFRVLATNDVDLPVLNIFRMFAQMRGKRLKAHSSAQIPLEETLKDSIRKDPDVGALAARDGDTIFVMVWHYHDDDIHGPSADIELTLEGVSWDGDAKGRLSHYRVDDKHSNSYSAWLSMGSPQDPGSEQCAKLKLAGQLEKVKTETAINVKGGEPTLCFELPRQGVSLLVLEGLS